MSTLNTVDDLATLEFIDEVSTYYSCASYIIIGLRLLLCIDLTSLVLLFWAAYNSIPLLFYIIIRRSKIRYNYSIELQL